MWSSFRAGSRLVDAMPVAALIDGAWTIALHAQTELVSRTWDAPYPWGTIGQYSTRLLYGTSWTVMMAVESLSVIELMGGKYDWIGEASYRSDWVMPLDLPACTRPGANGGCGIGIGGYAFLQVRPVGLKWWFEIGGGWIQQRVLNDALRTVTESTWVLSPITALRELKTDLDKPLALRVFAGPGLFFGLHAAHLHPTTRGAEIYDDIPWHAMYVLDGGIGPGARIEGRVIALRNLSFEADLTIAPFLLGGPAADTSADVAPLDFARDGWSVYRRLGAGIGYDNPRIFPFKPTVSFFSAELSDRPVERIGYRGAMVRFDIPLKVPTEN